MNEKEPAIGADIEERADLGFVHYDTINEAAYRLMDVINGIRIGSVDGKSPEPATVSEAHRLIDRIVASAGSFAAEIRKTDEEK